MTKLTIEEYERLKKFMGLYYDWYMARPDSTPDLHPLVVMANVEASSRSNARRGLLITINDFAEETLDWTADRVAEADKRFLDCGAPSLSEIRAKYSKNYAKILKRGKIKSEEEYYVIKGIVDGVLEPDSPESAKLSAMLEDFEQRMEPGSRA